MPLYTIDTNALKKAMVDAGLNGYVELAERANINRNTVSDVINGRIKPTLNVMYAIANALRLNSVDAGKIFFHQNIT